MNNNQKSNKVRNDRDDVINKDIKILAINILHMFKKVEANMHIMKR